MLNLLYLDDNKNDRPAVEHLSDFMLDKILAAITPNIQIQKAAEEILVRPLSDINQIEYRREILKDFTAHRVPLEKMRELSGGFARIHNDYKNKKSSLFRLFKGQSDYPGLLIHAAAAVRQLIDLIYSLNDIFRGSTPESGVLNKVRMRLQKLADAPEMRELYGLAERFAAYHPNESKIEADFSIDSDGKISRFGMISVSKFLSEDKSVKKRGFSIFGKNNTPEPSSGMCAGLTSDDCSGIISKTAREILEAFEYIITSVCGEFSGIYYDSAFYVFGVKYCEALENAGIPVCFAELSGSTEITSLHDVYLLLTLPDPSCVVPNDFSLEGETKGVIITGDNSAGKTVYLRAAAMAYIFTAAGLPIPAESAKISLPKDISLQMASAERAYQSGDITGRFEEEVIDLKKIVDSAQADTIIMLNEVFQTTDYSEGARGLYYILEYLGKKGAKWLLVTHLKQLAVMYKNDPRITKLRIGGNGRYKVGSDEDYS